MKTKLVASRNMLIYKNVKTPKHCSRCNTKTELMLCRDGAKGYCLSWCCNCTIWKRRGTQSFSSLFHAYTAIGFKKLLARICGKPVLQEL